MASRQIGSDQVDHGVHALLEYFQKRIGDLVSFGFDPTNAAPSYLDQRPEYVALDID